MLPKMGNCTRVAPNEPPKFSYLQGVKSCLLWRRYTARYETGAAPRPNLKRAPRRASKCRHVAAAAVLWRREPDTLAASVVGGRLRSPVWDARAPPPLGDTGSPVLSSCRLGECASRRAAAAPVPLMPLTMMTDATAGGWWRGGFAPDAGGGRSELDGLARCWRALPPRPDGGGGGWVAPAPTADPAAASC